MNSTFLFYFNLFGSEGPSPPFPKKLIIKKWGLWGSLQQTDGRHVRRQRPWKEQGVTANGAGGSQELQ